MPTDLHETIAALNANPDAEAAAGAYLDHILNAYWKQKDIDAVITLADAGLAYTLAHSTLKQSAGAIAYNLASFCWPGWNEPGIALTPAQIARGAQAAQQHADILQTLNPDPITRSRTLWVRAAYHLTAREYDHAKSKFTEAAALASAASSASEALFNHAYAKLAESLQSNDPQHHAELNQLKSQLHPLKDGPFYVTQLETAEAVCRQ